MACTAASLLSQAAAAGILSPDERTVLLAIIGGLLPGAGSPTVNTTIANATTKGFENGDDFSLMAAFAEFLRSSNGTTLTAAETAAAVDGFFFVQEGQIPVCIAQSSLNHAGITLAQAITNANNGGYAKLEAGDLWVCIVQLAVNNTNTFQALVNGAATAGFFKPDMKSLMAMIADMFCVFFSSSAPAAPVSQAATNIAATSFSANWAASAGATSYFLDVSTSPVFASFVAGFNNLNVGNVTTFSVTGLTAGTTYYYRVRATNAGGTSGNSGTQTLTTAPNVPTALLIDLTTVNGTIKMAWTASAGNQPTTYEIWRSVNGGAYALVNSVAGNVVTFTHAASLNASDQWYYEVRACNGSACSAFTDPAGVFRTFAVTVNSGQVTYSFPFLQFNIGAFQISNQVATTTISLPKLRKVDGELDIRSNAALATLDISSLITVNGDFNCDVNGSLSTFTATALTTTTGGLLLDGTGNALALSLPALTSTLFIQMNGSGITTVTANNLVTISNHYDATGSTSLTSVSMTSLVTMGVNGSDLGACPNLTTVSIPNVIFDNFGFPYGGDSDNLDQATVDLYLHRGVVSNVTTDTFELANGTNSTPSAAGLADVATLLVRGNTVNTN